MSFKRLNSNSKIIVGILVILAIVYIIYNMPAVIKMRLSNGNPTFQQFTAYSKANLAPVPQNLPTNKNTALNSLTSLFENYKLLDIL